MASAVNAFDIEAMRNRLSGVTIVIGIERAAAEGLDVGEPAVGDDAVDQAGHMVLGHVALEMRVERRASASIRPAAGAGAAARRGAGAAGEQEREKQV